MDDDANRKLLIHLFRVKVSSNAMDSGKEQTRSWWVLKISTEVIRTQEYSLTEKNPNEVRPPFLTPAG